MKLKYKILKLLEIDFVIDTEPFFENQRIVERGNLKILQKLIDGNTYYSSYWEDIKII